MTMKDIGFTAVVLFLGVLIVAAADNSLVATLVVTGLIAGLWAWTLICERRDKTAGLRARDSN